jgi:hypothetical protein
MSTPTVESIIAEMVRSRLEKENVRATVNNEIDSYLGSDEFKYDVKTEVAKSLPDVIDDMLYDIVEGMENEIIRYCRELLFNNLNISKKDKIKK